VLYFQCHELWFLFLSVVDELDVRKRRRRGKTKPSPSDRAAKPTQTSLLRGRKTTKKTTDKANDHTEMTEKRSMGVGVARHSYSGCCGWLCLNLLILLCGNVVFFAAIYSYAAAVYGPFLLFVAGPETLLGKEEKTNLRNTKPQARN
jgi:hypothetical protein